MFAICVAVLVSCGIFAIGCIVADYVFPKSKLLNRWIDSLPANWNNKNGGV